MNIGSAKVEQDITREIPHHLIDVVHIGEKFTAGDFREKANMAIKVLLYKVVLHNNDCLCGNT